MNIAIIGAGPVGSHAARLLCEKGHSVSLLEQHATVGSPIQCTGLLTSTFDEFNIPMSRFLVNRTKNIVVKTPSRFVHFSNQNEYVVCRRKFDIYMVNRAVDAGASLFLNHHFVKRNGSKSILVKDKTEGKVKEIHFDAIIGADGPLSKTAKEFGLYSDRTFYHGVQATVRGDFDKDTFVAQFGNNIAPGLFAWVVPEDDSTARVGLGTLQASANSYFNKFLEVNGWTDKIAIQSGLVPLYNPNQVVAGDSCYLLGDAAGQVKATTLGGIIPGMKSAEVLAASIDAGTYVKDLRSVRFQLWLHLRLRRMFDAFSDKDWDYLVHLMDKEKIKKILSSHTRERPSSILMKAVLKEPRFLKYTSKIF
tara:strand:+ start:1700 stop:2791 length:1092 start_codon:yes stop_codon:yes gene_type:complete